MATQAEIEAQAERLIAAFDELRGGGDDGPFWPLLAEYTAGMPDAMRDSLYQAFADHLGKILEKLDGEWLRKNSAMPISALGSE
jgi:hypothetical protein